MSTTKMRAGAKSCRLSVKVTRETYAALLKLPWSLLRPTLDEDGVNWFTETILREGVAALAASAGELDHHLIAPIHFKVDHRPGTLKPRRSRAPLASDVKKPRARRVAA